MATGQPLVWLVWLQPELLSQEWISILCGLDELDVESPLVGAGEDAERVVADTVVALARRASKVLDISDHYAKIVTRALTRIVHLRPWG